MPATQNYRRPAQRGVNPEACRANGTVGGHLKHSAQLVLEVAAGVPAGRIPIMFLFYNLLKLIQFVNEFSNQDTNTFEIHRYCYLESPLFFAALPDFAVLLV